MANFVFNIAKGRVAELYNRVDTNDAASSVLLVVPVDVGATLDATIIDFNTLADVLAGGVTERTTGGWNRKTITDADIAAFAPDDANDRVDLVISDQTWTAVTAGVVTDLIICYSPTGGADSTVVPLTMHDFPITPDGSDIIADLPATGFFRAS